jgi:hypothetical protein
MLDFDHPNLVRLVGVAVQQRPWLTVIEFMNVRTFFFSWCCLINFGFVAAVRRCARYYARVPG